MRKKFVLVQFLILIISELQLVIAQTKPGGKGIDQINYLDIFGAILGVVLGLVVFLIIWHFVNKLEEKEKDSDYEWK